MLTGENLLKTLMSLANAEKYGGGSRGYLPFLLHAKWELDNGKEGAISLSGDAESVRRCLVNKYECADIGELLPNEESILHHHVVESKDFIPNSMFEYAVQTIRSLDLSESNIRRWTLAETFDTYLNVMELNENFSVRIRNREIASFSRTAEEVLKLLAGSAESVYDPFAETGYALTLAGGNPKNLRTFRGAEKNTVRSLIAKIRMDFHGKSADIAAVSTPEFPEITADGTLKKYPLVLSCINSIRKFGNPQMIVAHDRYNRFCSTVIMDNLEEERKELSERCGAGIVLGQALAVTAERCILFGYDIRENDITRSMDANQFRSFIFSDLLEAVIQIGTETRFEEKPTTIYLFNRKKDAEHAGKIYFLKTDENTLDPLRICEMIQNAEEVPGVSRLVANHEIPLNIRNSLSLPRHITTLQKPNQKNPDAVLRSLSRLEDRGCEISHQINRVWNELKTIRDRN